MIDLDALRRVIRETPDDGTAATVTRRFLVQVERELTEGRAAAAELAGQRIITNVIGTLQAGAAG